MITDRRETDPVLELGRTRQRADEREEQWRPGKPEGRKIHWDRKDQSNA